MWVVLCLILTLGINVFDTASQYCLILLTIVPAVCAKEFQVLVLSMQYMIMCNLGLIDYQGLNMER